MTCVIFSTTITSWFTATFVRLASAKAWLFLDVWKLLFFWKLKKNEKLKLIWFQSGILVTCADWWAHTYVYKQSHFKEPVLERERAEGPLTFKPGPVKPHIHTYRDVYPLHAYIHRKLIWQNVSKIKFLSSAVELRSSKYYYSAFFGRC